MGALQVLHMSLPLGHWDLEWTDNYPQGAPHNYHSRTTIQVGRSVGRSKKHLFLLQVHKVEAFKTSQHKREFSRRPYSKYC